MISTFERASSIYIHRMIIIPPVPPEPEPEPELTNAMPAFKYSNFMLFTSTSAAKVSQIYKVCTFTATVGTI